MEERTGSLGNTKHNQGKFNLIDLFVILILLAIVFAVVFLIDPFSTNAFRGEEKNVVLEYIIQIDYVEASLTDNIRLGDETLNATNKTSLGRVSAIRNDILYSEAYYNSEADVVYMQEYPDRYNLQITITSDAIYEEGKGYSIKGSRIAVGRQYSLMFPNYLGSGYCIAVREVK